MTTQEAVSKVRCVERTGTHTLPDNFNSKILTDFKERKPDD